MKVKGVTVNVICLPLQQSLSSRMKGKDSDGGNASFIVGGNCGVYGNSSSAGDVDYNVQGSHLDKVDNLEDDKH